MREGWKEVILEDIAEYGKEKILYSNVDSSNFISADNMFPEIGGITSSDYTPTKGNISKYETGNILLSNIRPYFKKMWFAVFDGGCSNDVLVIKTKSVDVDSKFLFYNLSQQEFFDFIMAGANGVKMPRGNKNALIKFKINLPPLETQRKIASILSGYDDLIENNLKRIKILEEMAQQTYEEWFVRMRFPGYETAVMNEETGLPEGWESLKLGDKIEVGRGSSPRPIADKKYFEGGTIPWLKIADATASKIYIYKTKEYVNDYGASFSRKLPIGSLILAASGTLGFPMFLGVEACIHDGWIYFKGVEDDLKEYFYFSFIGLKQYFDGIAYGAAIQNINTTILRESPLIVPDIDTLKNFKSIASGALDTIVNLQQQNQRLREARDLLLPRLMMGIVEV